MLCLPEQDGSVPTPPAVPPMGCCPLRTLFLPLPTLCCSPKGAREPEFYQICLWSISWESSSPALPSQCGDFYELPQIGLKQVLRA